MKRVWCGFVIKIYTEWINCLFLMDLNYGIVKPLVLVLIHFFPKTHFQVSLRDPIREGADDNELRQIIGAAVCFLISYAQAVKN